MHTSLKPMGEKSTRTYCMMTEEAKHLIRSLLKALHHFHINGACLPHFDVSNIVVTTSGGVKVKDIRLQGQNDSLIIANYRDAHAILMRTMFGNCPPSGIPEDINHLVQLMNNRAIGMGYVISTHASLVPLGNRMQFFFDMYEQIKSVSANKQKERILKALPYRHDWHKRLQGNALLEESFHGGYTPYDLNGGPIVFLNFYSHTSVHRTEKYLKPLKHNRSVVSYPKYLPRIQEKPENENRLRALNLHRLF